MKLICLHIPSSYYRRTSSRINTLTEEKRPKSCVRSTFLAIRFRNAPTPITRKHVEYRIYICIVAIRYLRLPDFYATGNSREFIHSAGVKVPAFLRQFLNSFRRDAPDVSSTSPRASASDCLLHFRLNGPLHFSIQLIWRRPIAKNNQCKLDISEFAIDCEKAT